MLNDQGVPLAFPGPSSNLADNLLPGVTRPMGLMQQHGMLYWLLLCIKAWVQASQDPGPGRMD